MHDQKNWGKPTFANLFSLYGLNYGALRQLEQTTGLSWMTIHAIYLGQPVSRGSAEVALAAFSELVQYKHTLENTTIPLLEEEKRLS